MLAPSLRPSSLMESFKWRQEAVLGWGWARPLYTSYRDDGVKLNVSLTRIYLCISDS